MKRDAVAAVSSGSCYTVSQVARLLGVNTDKVRLWIATDELRAVNVGRGRHRPRWRIFEKDLDDFLAANASVPREEYV